MSERDPISILVSQSLDLLEQTNISEELENEEPLSIEELQEQFNLEVQAIERLSKQIKFNEGSENQAFFKQLHELAIQKAQERLETLKAQIKKELVESSKIVFYNKLKIKSNL